MSGEIKVIPVEFLCQEGRSKVSGEFTRGLIGAVPLSCEYSSRSYVTNGCKVTIRRIRDPDIEGVIAFQVAGLCAQKNIWINQRIKVIVMTGQTLRSE